MRKVYRDRHNIDYWNDRWEKAGVDNDEFDNLNTYPIKYANIAVKDKSQKILEAGCGAGRVYFHYKNSGFDIKGLEYSRIAVDNIMNKDPEAEVVQGDITDLPYENDCFDVCLAFGLYHNLETVEQIEKAFSETARVLKKGGKLVASVRYDSLENRVIERIVNSGNKNEFHRMHFDVESLKKFLKKNNFRIKRLVYARNVSFLFKFDCFRKKR